MPLLYRTARAEELDRAQELVAASINDLTERHGFGKIASARPALFQAFSLHDDPEGLWVAEDESGIVGFCFSWVCGDLWFLAELFVAPDQQGRGVGNELLKRSLRQADRHGAKTRALITFPFNRVSQALYIRHGMFPRLPVCNFSAGRDTLLPRLPAARLRTMPLTTDPADVRELQRIDMAALGVSREKHHRFLLGDRTQTGVLLYRGTECVGYAYFNAGGNIGPLAVTGPGDIAPAFDTVLGLVLDAGAPQASAFLPGSAEAALTAAVAYGMRITLPMLLMSSRDFGRWPQYMPRNPGFM